MTYITRINLSSITKMTLTRNNELWPCGGKLTFSIKVVTASKYFLSRKIKTFCIHLFLVKTCTKLDISISLETQCNIFLYLNEDKSWVSCTSLYLWSTYSWEKCSIKPLHLSTSDIPSSWWQQGKIVSL